MQLANFGTLGRRREQTFRCLQSFPAVREVELLASTLRRPRTHERWNFCQPLETFVREVIIGLRALRVRAILLECLEVVCRWPLAFSALEAVVREPRSGAPVSERSGLKALVDALSATPTTLSGSAVPCSSTNGTNVDGVGLCLE